MTTFEKKAWPDLFEKVKSGRKNFDLRLADFKCREGDILVLKEWDPKTNKFTGKILKKKIAFILKTKDCEKFWSKKEIKKYGFQIFSLKKL